MIIILGGWVTKESTAVNLPLQKQPIDEEAQYKRYGVSQLSNIHFEPEVDIKLEFRTNIGPCLNRELHIYIMRENEIQPKTGRKFLH